MSILKSKHSGWTFEGRRTPFFGGGGGGGPTSSTVTNTNIPEYARPYVESMLGATQQQLFNTSPQAPQYDAEGNQTNKGAVDITGIKGYTPYSQNPQDYVAGFSPLQQQAQQGVSGMQLPGQYGMATNAALGGLGAYGNLGNAAANQQFMNPYLQNALTPQLEEMRRQYGITGTQEQSAATGAGAFGGSREALMASENARNMNTAMNQAIGQGYNTAFNNAQQMQLAQAQGLGQAAQGLGALGGQMLQGQQGIYNLQNQFGQQQQNQQQNIINQAVQNYATAQQYPQQQLAFMNAMIRGLPLQTMTTQGYQAAPNMFSQLGGLAATGIGAYGALKKEGGVIKEKKFVGGGIAESVTADLESMDDAHLLQQAKTSPSAIVRRQAAQILAERQAAQGIEQAQSNLPTQYAADGGIMQVGDSDDGYAGGGMVAFERGGIAALPVKRYNGVYPEGSFVFEDAFGGEPYSKTATRTPTMGTKEVLENLERGKKAEAAAKAAKTVKTAADASKGIALSPWERMVGAGGSKAVGRFLSPLVSAPAAVVSTGGEYLTNAAGNTVKAMSPEMRQMLAEGDVGSDTSLAAAIMNVAGPEKAKEVKEDKKATPAAPSPAAPNPAAPAAKKDDGIDSLIADASGSKGIDAMFGNTPLGRLQAEAYKKVQEADLKQSKAQSDLDKQREEIESRKGQKLYQALMMGGAEAMAGTSPYALANIGRGIAGGVKDYAEAEKAERAEKKLLLQYQTALDQADYAKKMGNFTALEQIQGRLAGLKVAAMNAGATKQAALDAAHQKSFGELVAKLMYQNGLTEEQAIASASKIYASGNKGLGQGVTVTPVTPAKS